MLNILVVIQRIIASNVSYKDLTEEQFLLDYCCLVISSFLSRAKGNKHVNMYGNQIMERLARLLSDYIVPMFNLKFTMARVV